MKKIALLFFWTALALMGAEPPVLSYPPEAGAPGSTAIAKDDVRFVSWANGNLPPAYGRDVDSIWKTPQKAWGPATSDVYDIVCLGNGGRITMVFPHPVKDGDGADFAVFENSFSHRFLELAFVEISSDGVNFFRFPSVSNTPGRVGPFAPDSMDPTKIHNLAGKYKGGFGTPFDLADIGDSPLLDKQRVRFVRIVDIIGDGGTPDSRGMPIYDPFPTEGSGGFDLDAVGVIHQNDGGFRMIRSQVVAGNFELEWESNPGSRYRLETSVSLEYPAGWGLVWEGAGSQVAGVTAFPVPMTSVPKKFWRVVRLD